MGTTKGGLKADSGGMPASTVPFPELANESAATSWAEIDPTKVLGRRRSRWCPWIARGGERRRRCRPWKNGGAWGRRQGRSSPPKSIQAWKVRGLRFGGAGPMAMVGRKGRETSPPQPIPGMESSQSLRGREGGGGRVRSSARKVPYQARKVQRTRNKITQTRRRGAVEWLGHGQ